MAYACNGIVFGMIKEGNPAICGSIMSFEDIMLGEIKSSQDKYCMMPFIYEVYKIVKHREAESRIMISGD